jgi:hypothetical protein
VLVRVQEQFVPSRQPHTLLAELDEYVSGCTTAICVIGKRSGACPAPEATAPFAHILPEGVAQASYTQREYFLVRHYGKECLLFIAQDVYRQDEATPHGADFPDLQRDFVARIRHAGLRCERFATTNELCRRVHQWPERTTPTAATLKPIVLPYLGARRLSASEPPPRRDDPAGERIVLLRPEAIWSATTSLSTPSVPQLSATDDTAEIEI